MPDKDKGDKENLSKAETKVPTYSKRPKNKKDKEQIIFRGIHLIPYSDWSKRVAKRAQKESESVTEGHPDKLRARKAERVREVEMEERSKSSRKSQGRSKRR